MLVEFPLILLSIANYAEDSDELTFNIKDVEIVRWDPRMIGSKSWLSQILQLLLTWWGWDINVTIEADDGKWWIVEFKWKVEDLDAMLKNNPYCDKGYFFT